MNNFDVMGSAQDCSCDNDIDQGIHLGKNKVARNEKKKLWVFCIPKIWKILKRFTGTFHQA